MDEGRLLRGFAEYLSRSGLRATRQRDQVVRAFFAAGRHIGAEELHRRIRADTPGVGLVTVYRTLKLLRQAGLATERRFQEPYARFDPRPAASPHHHLICLRCGGIREFEDGSVQGLARKVRRAMGFRVTEPKLELYGICRACAEEAQSPSGRRAPAPKDTR